MVGAVWVARGLLCIGYCTYFNLSVLERIIWVIFAFLLFVAVWNDERVKGWKKFEKELKKKKMVNGQEGERIGADKGLYYIQKLLDYLSEGLIIRQILSPYILFPIFALVFWILVINKTNTTVLVLSLTLIAIIWYSRETLVLRQKQMKANKIAQESNDLQEKPVLTFFIRNITSWETWKKNENEDYIIDGYWLLRIRNMGKGIAFNLEVTSDKFKVVRYKTKILGPESDEQSIKIQDYQGNDIINVSDLIGAMININCDSISRKKYKFKYKITRIGESEIMFLGEEK